MAHLVPICEYCGAKAPHVQFPARSGDPSAHLGGLRVTCPACKRIATLSSSSRWADARNPLGPIVK